MAFSKRVAAGEALSANSAEQGERGIWQRRYWEHTIRNDRDYATHMDYIHVNPVKHGLVTEAAAWPFSSFHKSVAMGLYPLAWTGNDDAADDRGERR
jgi:putative transposase